MSHGPFGKRPEKLPVELGGTDSGTEAEAREALDVPSLSQANTFSGACTFTASQTVGQTFHANTQLSTDGSVAIEEGSIDATLLTGVQSYQLPDDSGTLLLDAPSDGKYYVRKDGAWVEIIP